MNSKGCYLCVYAEYLKEQWRKDGSVKSEDLSRKQHDMKGALACLYGVVEAVRFGDFDFASSDGQELLEQAEAAQKLLSKEIEVCFQHLRQLEQK